MQNNLPRRGLTWLRDSTGANLVEAALITPLLLFLTFGIVEFAMIFWVWLALQNGASQASRYAVTGNQMVGISREDSVKTAMRDATPSLTLPDTAFSFSHMSPGAGVWTAGIGGPSDIGRVTVTYRWTIVTPMIRPFFNAGQVNFSVQSAMKNEGRFN